MEKILQEPRFDFLTAADKEFVRAFDGEMTRLGYDFGGKIGSGYCWGRYMLIYTRSGVKSKNVYARVYLRDTGAVLRLFFSDVDRHRRYIEAAPAYIQEAFTGPFGDCNHDRDEGGGTCRFRKTYTIAGRLIEKCNGLTFEFPRPAEHGVKDYIALFSEFYPAKRAAGRA